MCKQHIDRYVIARDRNVERVDFQRKPEPPAPKFPGAGALRISQSASCNGPERSPTGAVGLAAPMGSRLQLGSLK